MACQKIVAPKSPLSAKKIGTAPKQKIIDKAATIAKPSMSEKTKSALHPGAPLDPAFKRGDAAGKADRSSQPPKDGWIIIAGSKCPKCGNKLSTAQGWTRCSFVKCDKNKAPWRGIGNVSGSSASVTGGSNIPAPAPVRKERPVKVSEPGEKNAAEDEEGSVDSYDPSCEVKTVSVLTVKIKSQETMQGLRRHYFGEDADGDEDVIVKSRALQELPAAFAELLFKLAKVVKSPDTEIQFTNA